jgi:hypothetical protein
MTRFTLVALLAWILAGCGAATTSSPQTPAVVDRGPPPMPKQMTHAELERRTAAGELRIMELEAVSREEVSVGRDDQVVKPAADEVVTTSSMPGGSTSTIYVDRFRRIWIVTQHHSIGHVPEGVSISATRVFSTRWKVPISYRVVGSIEIRG